MNYVEFRDTYRGQLVDVDNFPKEWKYQCYDLVQLYFKEVLNVPDYILANCEVVKNMIEWDWKHNQLLEYFDEVDIHEMEQGDVCFWTGSECGHTAVYDSWNGYECWYFSQNPNPCDVITIELEGLHAFRRKKDTPPLPPITPIVERDKNKDQLEVIVPELNVRTIPTTSSDILGVAPKGIYNYYEIIENEGYKWYRIAENQWIAESKDYKWINVYPKENTKTEEQIQKEFVDKILENIPEFLYGLIKK